MIYRLDEFTENSINPITGIPYDASWVIWQLTDSKEYKMTVGSFNGCAYSVKFSRFFDGWEMSVCDFTKFNKSQNKNMILVISERELKSAQKNTATVPLMNLFCVMTSRYTPFTVHLWKALLK